ncbi:MAG TPA: GNAT family N-acetyltransferase [Gemmatimonadales bacterium]|nr:GNAT family N-acetyltransferase [Gemmatimonadales bacterium]
MTLGAFMSHRRAGVADAEAIARLHIASWRAAYRGLLPDAFLDSQDLAERTDMWRGKLTDSSTTVLVAEAAAGMLGFCACGPSHDPDADTSTVWEIYNLHVTPDLRGGGIGGRLFDAAVSLGLQHGARDLTLWVLHGNSPAERFYQHKGMTPDGARQSRAVGPDVTFAEVRYRVRIGSISTG